MSELKCCPFCGGEATEHSRCNYEETAGETMFFVRCKNCGVETSWEYEKEKAKDLWNTRKPVDRIVEQLEDEKCKNVTYKDRYAQGWNNGTANAIYIVKQEINNGLE